MEARNSVIPYIIPSRQASELRCCGWRWMKRRLMRRSISLYQFRDLRIHDLWVPHLVSQTPRFEIVFSNEPVTSRLFKESGFRVEPIPFYDREQFSATEIRERIVKGSGWEKLVPPSTSAYIRTIFGDERLRELALSDKPSNQRHEQRFPF